MEKNNISKSSKLKEGKILRFRINNFGILKDIEVNLGHFTLLLGKNRIGKTTFLEALQRLEFIINNRVPVNSSDYLQFLKKLEWDDNNTLFLLEFKIETEPDIYSGIYSYLIELDREGIVKEELKILNGSYLDNLNKLYNKQHKEISLISRIKDRINYLRINQNNIEKQGEIKVSFRDIPITFLFWDENREPYMFFIRNFLSKIGGFSIKISINTKLIGKKDDYVSIQSIQRFDELTMMLHFLKREKKEILEKLEHYLKIIYTDFEGFEIPKEEIVDIIYMKEKRNEHELKIPNYYFSKGTQRLTINLIKALLAEDLKTNQLVVIDEIENSLHPALLDKYIQILDSMNIQIISTTHSPILLDFIEEGDIRIFYEEEGMVKVSNGYNKKILHEDFNKDVPEISKIKLSEIWLNGNETDLIFER